MDATWVDEVIVGLTVRTIGSDGVACDAAAAVQMAVGSRAVLVDDVGGVVVVEALASLVRRGGFTKVGVAVGTAGRSGTTSKATVVGWKAVAANWLALDAVVAVLTADTVVAEAAANMGVACVVGLGSASLAASRSCLRRVSLVARRPAIREFCCFWKMQNCKISNSGKYIQLKHL